MKKQIPTFSIVIPAYNAENNIVNALEGIRKQTFQDYEIIITDDGSTDDTRKVILQYKEQHPEIKIRYFWQENGGASSARWLCTKKAKGKYIAYLDADDIWYSNKLEVVMQTIKKHKAQVYYHNEVEVGLNGKRKKLSYRKLNKKDPLTDLIINGNALSTSATIVERTFHERCDPFYDKKRMGEDYECWIRLATAGAKFYFINKVLGEYRRNIGSLTLKDDRYVKATNEEIVGFYDYLDKKNFSLKEINKLKLKRKAYNEYVLGRHYHQQGNYFKAIVSYKKSFKMGNCGLKCIAAMVLSLTKKAESERKDSTKNEKK